MDPYQELANAIVLQAVKDYRMTDDERELKEIETYLGQARFLDMRIKSKIQQIDSLRELATSCTAVFSDMPRNPNHGSSKVERCVLKIIEVQEGLKDDINELVELKKEIMSTIKAVDDVELQTLLEKRYLCFLSWEKIAVEMHYSIQHIYRMHDSALAAVTEILDARSA